MPKKCMICGKPAYYMVRGTNDAYCMDCAKDCFSDLSFLEQVERDAKVLKGFVDSQKPL
jgi:hypothetical protein